MAAVMTKRGTQDNVVTYEHVCDTNADMAAINPQYINLGSICLVINGESGGLEVYIADSNKEWSAISVAAGGGGGGESGGLSIHICSANEYDSNTKTPTITAPAADTIYLVPTGSTTGDLFSEWIYVDSAWERIGGTSIDLSQYATKTDLNNYVTKSDYNRDLEHRETKATYVMLYKDFNNKPYYWDTIGTDYADLGEIYTDLDQNECSNIYARIIDDSNNTYRYLRLVSGIMSSNGQNVVLTFSGIDQESTTGYLTLNKLVMSGPINVYDDGAQTTIQLRTQPLAPINSSTPFRYVTISYDTNTNSYSWGNGYTDPAYVDLIHICSDIAYTPQFPTVYAIISEEEEDATLESGVHNYGRLFPLISTDITTGFEIESGNDVHRCKAVFGSTYMNDNNQTVFESFTITGIGTSDPSNDTVTHTITPIASSAGSFTAAEELSDVVTNLKSLVQEVAYTTSSSHAAATITSIDTLLTALDTMKPQPTYTANVIYENFTNNATRFSTDNVPINFANGDYVEALIDVTTCSQDQENILSVGTSIDGFDTAVAYLFYWRNQQIQVRLKDTEASIAVDRAVAPADTSAVLIRIDSTGAYVDGNLVKDITGDNVTHINSAGTYKIGCRMSKLNTATYDHITVYNKN